MRTVLALACLSVAAFSSAAHAALHPSHTGLRAPPSIIRGAANLALQRLYNFRQITNVPEEKVTLSGIIQHIQRNPDAYPDWLVPENINVMEFKETFRVFVSCHQQGAVAPATVPNNTTGFGCNYRFGKPMLFFVTTTTETIYYEEGQPFAVAPPRQ